MLRRPSAHGLPEVRDFPGVVFVDDPDGSPTKTTPHAPCGEPIVDGFTPGLSPRRSGGWGPARLTPDETPKKKINDNQELSSSRLLGPAGREDSEELGANDRPRGGLAQTTHLSSPARRRAFMGLKRRSKMMINAAGRARPQPRLSEAAGFLSLNSSRPAHQSVYQSGSGPGQGSFASLTQPRSAGPSLARS